MNQRVLPFPFSQARAISVSLPHCFLCCSDAVLLPSRDEAALVCYQRVPLLLITLDFCVYLRIPCPLLVVFVDLLFGFHIHQVLAVPAGG